MANSNDPVHFFIKSLSEQFEPSIVFLELSMDMHKELKSYCISVDIDYLLIYGPPAVILSLTAFLTFLGTHSGKIDNFVQSHTIYSEKCDGTLLVFGKISKFDIAIHVSSTATDGISQETFLKAKLSALLSEISGQYPFRDIAKILKTKFRSFNIAIYAYRQKTPVDFLLPIIIELSMLCYVEIAIRVEFYLDNLFVTPKYNRFKYFSYSNFLSNTSCNLLIDAPAICMKLVNKSYRYAAYNTIQHSRSRTSYELTKLTNSEEVSENAILTMLGPSMKQNISSILRLFSGMQTPKLRLEAYFVIRSIEEFQLMSDELITSIEKLQLVYCPIADIKVYVKAI